MATPFRARHGPEDWTRLVAHIAFRLRNVHSLNRQRLVAAALCMAVLPAAVRIPAIDTLAAIGGICAVLVTYESTRFREARAEVRARASDNPHHPVP